MPKAKKEKTEEIAKKEKLSEKEFEEKVLELAKGGLTSEKIGESLRLQKIHPKDYEKISRILKAKNLYQPAEIKNVSEKLERVTKHKDKHIQDKRAMRERERIFSLLRKQKEYYQIP